jgi:hypothetical protein
MCIDYKEIMEEKILRLSESLKHRRKLDNEIARLKKMVRWAAAQRFAGRAEERSDKAGQSRALGLTESISEVLRTYDTWLSPVLVRDLLDSIGFDIDVYREPLPSIHVTLNDWSIAERQFDLSCPTKGRFICGRMDPPNF